MQRNALDSPIEFNPTHLVAIDTETTGLHAWKGDTPFAVSMCNSEGDTWYCEWPIDPYTRKLVTPYTQEVMDDLNFIRRVMEDESVTKVFHNGKFDIRMLELNFGIKLRGRLEETLFAARACNSLEEKYTLKHLGEKYCDLSKEDMDELQAETARLRRHAKDLGYSLAKEVAADYWLPRHFAADETDYRYNLCRRYAELDAVRTLLLWVMYDATMDELDVRSVYDNEMALWQCTYDMETRGVMVNIDICRNERIRNEKVVADAKAKMFALAGRELNVNSTAQLVQVCRERGIQPTEVTASGEPSMSFNSIRPIADDPFIHELQRYRAAHKVNNTFIDKYLWYAIPDWHPSNRDGSCLHPMFNQAAAQTWRYGCSHPNLQQVVNSAGARNAVESMSARMAFGPRPGYTWYHFDYSQLELYLFAGAAQEKFMLHHMMSGHDLHAECANKAWGGYGNPNALIKGMVALECEAEKPNTAPVAKIWEEYGWDPKWALDRKAKEEFTAWWLTKYGGKLPDGCPEWNIVKAEKKLRKKVARTRAKFVMYAKIYGGGWRAINNFLYCGEQEARAFQKEYDDAFPRIKQYLRIMCDRAKKDGYITNAYGMRIGIPPGYDYKAVNFETQSNAAGLLKASMRKVYNFLKEYMDDWHLLMTIHDELVFEVPTSTDDPMTFIDGTTKKWINEHGDEEIEEKDPYYRIDNPGHLDVFALKHIQRLMEDHEGRFSVPIPVEAARCDERWDVKVGVHL